MRRRLPRQAWPLLGAAAGVAAAVALTLLQDPVYRADASLVLVREGQPPGNDPGLAAAAEAAAELLETRAVAASALANLGSEEPPDSLLDRLDVEADDGSSLVRIEVEAPEREEARRTAQEVAVVSTVLFNDRFGPQTVASVWEAAEADRDRVGPRAGRALAVGALLGALAGWAVLLAVGARLPGLPRPSLPRLPQRAPRPERRPAAPPAEQPAAAEGHVPGTVPGTRPEEPQAPPPPAAPGPFVMPGFGEWTLGDVERLVAEQGPAFPELREELELYVDALRGVAAPDGSLSGDVDLVIEDVFAPLIARSGSTRRS
jgi:capsular polysaccharide biosynthesis protein